MSPPERQAALDLLSDEHLFERILCDFEACGVVGERHGKLLGYLCATSRLLDKPLGLVIQSSSAAGKTSLAEGILSFMPAEAKIVCSSMTSQSLYYAELATFAGFLAAEGTEFLSAGTPSLSFGVAVGADALWVSGSPAVG